MNDDNLFTMNGANGANGAKKDVVMKNVSATTTENTSNTDEKTDTEKTSADYYFDSYSHFGI